MSWQNEIVLIVRNLIGDTDCSSFTDERLEEVILVAAQFVNSEVDFDATYTIDIDSFSLSPDPTSPRDDMFISLVSLKSSCILARGLLRNYAASEGVRIRDGMGELQIGGRFASAKDMATEFCKAYEKAKLEYAMGNFATVRAIFNVASGPNINTYLGTNRSYWR